MPTRRLKPQSDPQVLLLHIAIAGIDPPIWRIVAVPETMTLEALHGTIQGVFAWFDYHLYAFEVNGKQFTGPDGREGSVGKAEDVTLESLRLKKGARFTYTYDFGDDWRHEIVLEARTPLTDNAFLPWCIGGERAGPLEDSGGPPGYDRLLKILADPDDPEHADMQVWAGPQFDAEAFDVRVINKVLMLSFTE